MFNVKKQSKQEGYFMTYENDMTSNSALIKTILLEHGHAYSFLTVMAEGSVVEDRDPRKDYSVYSLVLSRESLLIAVDHINMCSYFLPL